MFSSGFNGSPMHSPSMMASTSQKKFFGQDYPTPLSPMHQQQRQDYNAYGSGRNGHLTEERDTSLSLSSPSRYATSMQSHLSPRNRYHGGFSPKNSSYPHGDIGQLQGVWNAFESVTSELGKELRDCLSNKAIFEACVVQEQSHHQGKRMTTAEKNEEANLRKMKYEDVLDVTINRHKGLFSSAVMAAQQEIQNSMDMKLEEHRQHFSRQLSEMERSFANRSSEREASMAHRSSERELSYTRQQDNFKREISRLQNECDQADSAIQKLQNEMSIQRQTLTQSLHAAEEGREAAVAELTATLGTLKSTCASAQTTEEKFHEAKKELAELQHTLNAEVETNRILRSAEEEMKEVISSEHERCAMLQRKNQEMEYSLQDACKNIEQANQENSELREQVKEVTKLQDALSSTIESLRETKQEFEKMSEEFQQKAELNSLLVSKVSALESQVEELMMDLETSRMSEAQLELSLEEWMKKIKDQKLGKAQLEASLEECMKKIEEQTLDLQAARMSEAEVEASLEECMKKIEDQAIDLQAARMSEAAVEASLEECMKKIDELTSLQKNLQDMQELNEKEHSQQMEANSSLENERDELKKSMKKLQEEYNEERDKIASALEGFDDEMASAATKLRTTQKELEDEKAKVKAHELSLEEVTKKMEDKLTLLKEENESACVKFEKEASVYNEAIKMLQKQVDVLQGLVDTGCERCSRIKLANDEAYESSVVKELEEKLKERDDEIMHLKEKCVKREESMVTLEKLCAKARNENITLRNENKSLEVEIQRYTNFHDVAQCDDGTTKAVDELLGPIIDAAPSMNDIDNMIDIGEKELKNIMTYVANEIGVGASCGEGVEIALNEEDRHSARRQLDPPDNSVP